MKTLRQLSGVAGDLNVEGDPDTIVTGMQYDSRAVEPGDLFVALRGSYFDGHDYIFQAVARGAVAVMTESDEQPVPALVCANTRELLPAVSAAFFGYPAKSMAVIGITGTDGKTTTSYLANAILEHAGLVTGLVGTVSVKIAGEIVEHETRQTTPESLDIQRHLASMRDAGVQWAILESTSHGLAAHRLDEIPFRIAAVTNITHEHLEFHGTVEAYRLAKASLFERAGSIGGIAVVNLDDEGSRSVIDHASGTEVLTYSRIDSDASIYASDVRSDVTGSTFNVRTPAGAIVVQLPYVGEFNVENSLCAIGIGIAAGIDLRTIREALRDAPPVPGRMVQVDEGQPFQVIVDYAHTPDSLEKILRLLRKLGQGRIICVSGSAGERDTAKRPMQGRVSAQLADFSVFTTEDPRFEDAAAIIEEIASGAHAAGACESRDFVKIVDRRAAIDHAIGLARPGDVIVLAGKGHERSIIWGLEKRPWDEGAVARELLRARGYRGSR